ncbi:MAG: HD domain-containing protein [Chloroflexota bacterium]
MDYDDVIYGRTTIHEPVLIALLESAAMQRLHGVLQHGISGLLGVTRPTTRFEHSMGVMLLVRRLGGSLEEQIAALLHDVSHTAFSHVIDYVFDGHDSQSYHDEKKAWYLGQSDVPAVLARHGYNWRDFLHEDRYLLLEQPAPALCADRLDYFLRDSVDLGLSTAADVERVLAHLVVHDGRIVIDDLPTARWLAETYIAADDASWASFYEVGLYEVAAQAIKTALQVGAISEQDLWSTDEVVWARLQAHDHPQLQAQLRLVSRQTDFLWDEQNPTFWVSTKVRTIDPDVLADGRLHRLSTLDTSFAQHRAAYLGRKQGKWPVRVVAN